MNTLHLRMLLLCFISLPLSSQAWAREFKGPYDVGLTIIDTTYQIDDQRKPLTMAIWYPTRTKALPHNYGGSTEGVVAIDAPIDATHGPYPLLVFSHGLGGSGLSATYLTETLASRGWVVAAPDHNDPQSAMRIRTGRNTNLNRRALYSYMDTLVNSNPEDKPKYMYRILEVKTALNELMNNPVWSPFVDKNRVAVGGHSFGGFSTIGLCGPISNMKDTRIKAALIYSSPIMGYLYTQEELSHIDMPVMYFVGANEKNARRGDHNVKDLNDRMFAALPSPKYFLELRGTNHFDFANALFDTWGARFLSGNDEQFETLRDYSIPFLEKYVVGNTKIDIRPEANDRRLTKFVYE